MNVNVELPRWKELQSAAREVRESAWAPYSNFQVGAAILTADNRIFVGCNVENASYGLTICAERVAVSSAVAQGCTSFVAICVSLKGTPVPCGACRQFLVEFGQDLLILLDDVSRPVDTLPELVRLAELLPRAFRLSQE